MARTSRAQDGLHLENLDVELFAEPRGQDPGVTLNNEGLRLPQGILQPDRQGASASGSSELLRREDFNRGKRRDAPDDGTLGGVFVAECKC